MAETKSYEKAPLAGQEEQKEHKSESCSVQNEERSASAVHVTVCEDEAKHNLLSRETIAIDEAVASVGEGVAVASVGEGEAAMSVAQTTDCDNTEQSVDVDLQNGIQPRVVQGQPTEQGAYSVPMMFWPPGLEDLIEIGQLVTHKSNLRHNEVIKDSSIARLEMIDETRRIRFYVEQEPNMSSSKSFTYSLYNRHKQEVMQVISTGSRTCVCCKASWHCFPQCHFQAMVFAPPGQLAGFVRRARSWFVQEFDILDANEDVVLVMRGGPYDLEIYSPDFQHELGRLAVHGWHGIMHEVKRTGEDIGITFPMDLAVHMKAVLVGAVFAIDWLYSTAGGRR